MEKDFDFETLDFLGFPMFTTSDKQNNVTKVFVQVIQKRDMRLWDAFPVLLANANQRQMFNYSEIMDKLKSKSEQMVFVELLVMSMAFFKYINLEFSWKVHIEELLKSDMPNQTALQSKYMQHFKRNDDFKISDKKLSPERISNIFSLYFQKNQDTGVNIEKFLSEAEKFDLEYSLSQIFSPKQKEIIFKKLKGEKLTKTEREYYSRTIKKKITALADPILHKLAQKLK